MSHLSLWTLSNPFYLFSDLLLLLILSITVKCLRRLPWWILWSACSPRAWSMFNVPYEYRSKWSGLVAGSWGNQDTADHSPVFTGLQTLSLAGADVGSYVLPNKITYQHSQMQNCSPGWEARGLSSCSPHFPSEIQWGHWNFIGTHSCSSAQKEPWAPRAPESVCTCDNWEAIWLSLRCRGTNVLSSRDTAIMHSSLLVC